MNALKWLVSGFIGGLVGAIIWALIYHYANFELGIIAWGVGALAGVGVRATAGDSEGFAPGAIAVVTALLTLSIGKVGGIYLDINSNLGSKTQSEERDSLIAIVASGVEIEYRHAGKAVETVGYSVFDPLNNEYGFPKHIWIEAEQRFDEYDEHQQAEFVIDPSELVPDEYAITYLADYVVIDWEANGKEVVWPGGITVSRRRCEWSGDYPTDVWSDAVLQWENMSSAEQREFKQSLMSYDTFELIVDAIYIAKYSFTFWDVLWFGLALFSACNLGSNEHDE